MNVRHVAYIGDVTLATFLFRHGGWPIIEGRVSALQRRSCVTFYFSSRMLANEWPPRASCG